MKGMTEYQWRVSKRAIRERFDQPDHLLSLAAGRNAIRDVVEAAVQKPSRQRRVRAASDDGNLGLPDDLSPVARHCYTPASWPRKTPSP